MDDDDCYVYACGSHSIFSLLCPLVCIITKCLGSSLAKCKKSRNTNTNTNINMVEACCLTSNSFTKITQPSIAPSSTPKNNRNHNSNHLHCKRVAFSSAVTCCHMEMEPSDDHNGTSIEGDWRSFRARLVAAEQAPSSQVQGEEDMYPPPPQIAVGDRWAHTIHEPEKGCLLIATEKLDGVHIFERTVILILSMEPMGPSGIILNRPSLMSIKEMRSTTLNVTGTFSDQPLFFGGLVEEGLFLVSPQEKGTGMSGVFEQVMEGLYFGTKESVSCAAEMVKRNVVGAQEFRFFDGCCGWENEQLNEEIRAGYWTVAACSPSLIGLDSATLGLWEEIQRLVGPEKVW